ncbi:MULTISPECIES: hypothetical protein [unclassified Frigoribacterium]|uniref:hypothetical protein n=1 Tax=unclassified Frigoribacterium TaxID=2627005 RepID=UPI0006FC9D86|nr:MULTISPECIES: hypothetical protein [unclassified Frigoribacterium]KQO47205.1 hypothetical protein ASF07_06275 [Frigoribacterium sp. Leaf254]KQT39297.1 hypothetical protein ASG28_06275 [Frigoribacterium sp. Leaf415]
MTSNPPPTIGRTTWSVLLSVALTLAACSVVLIVLDPGQASSYFTLIGMLCLIWSSITNLRRLR